MIVKFTRFNYLFLAKNVNNNLKIYTNQKSFLTLLRNNQKLSKTSQQIYLQTTRNFSLTPKNNFIPPIIWLVLKPITKLAAVVIGRGSRTWWKNLRPHLNRKLVLDHLNRNKVKYVFGTTSVSAGGYLFYYLHLQTTPITNRSRFILFLPFQVEEIEELSKSAFNEQYGKKVITNQTKDVKRVLNVINRLVSANKDIFEIRDTKWTVTVIDDDTTVNAAAYPSGHILVFTGLLKFVKNDDELAAVLGHEISHAENLSRSQFIDFLSIILVLTIWTVFPSDLTASFVHYFSGKFLEVGLELPFSRFLESEADEVGLHLAAKACYDVRYIPDFWRRQANEQQVPELFSTHPASLNRASEIEKLLPQALLLREQCKCYKLPEKIKAYK